MRWFLGLLVAVALVAGLTVAAVEVLDLDDDEAVTVEGTTTTSPTEVLPAEGQSLVTGTVASLHVEGAVIEPLVMPIRVTTAGSGQRAGATFQGITVDGREATIEWDAGRPLTLQGDGGSLVVGPVTIDADAGAMVVLLDGVHAFTPGVYEIASPVAVGAAGIADTVGSASFEASGDSTVEFRGGSTTTLDPRPLTIAGPGVVVLEGTFEVRQPEGTLSASRVELRSGPFEVTLTPVEGGYTVEATLQGPVQLS